MRRIVVTPAGRKRYLSILRIYIERAKEQGSIDEWHLWLNTNLSADIEYIRSLHNDWVHVIEPEVPVQEVNNNNICHFFPKAAEPDCVYVRLDDDIVYVAPGFFDAIIGFRLANPSPFLVYGNIVNNAIVSHLHQRNGRFVYKRLGGYLCSDQSGWNDPIYAEVVHRAFLDDVRRGQLALWKSSFTEWHCLDYERVSINCISWLGSTFAAFKGAVGQDEEQWLSVVKPRELGAHNVIFGGAIVAHFAFYTQRRHMDDTDILDQYRALTQESL